jgi:hypothetical protein
VCERERASSAAAMASLACSSSISGTHLLPTALAPAYSLRSCKISFRRSVESGSRRSGLFDVSNNTGHWILQRVRQYATVQAAATAKNDTTATTGRTAPIPPPSRVNVSPHGLSPPIVHRSVQWEFVLSISTEVDCLFSLRIYLGFFTLFHKFCFSGSDHGVLRQKTVDFARTPPHPVFCQ